MRQALLAGDKAVVQALSGMGGAGKTQLAAEYAHRFAAAAVDLRNLGELEAARELNEDILSRRGRILGNDHPLTQIPSPRSAT